MFVPGENAQRNESATEPIFIVYSTSDLELAIALKNLFHSWGITATYSDWALRNASPATPYRTFLAEKLLRARLVILLLSPSFQWSQYCQAEAGATAIYNQRMIAIVIPPAAPGRIQDICPVLGEFNVLPVSPSFDKWDVKERHRRLKLRHDDKWGTRGFLEKLREMVGNELPPYLTRRETKDTSLGKAVTAAANSIVDKNLLWGGHKAKLTIFECLDYRKSLAPASIVERIKLSLAGYDNEVTRLHFVGVSLKFSLSMITVALQEMAHEHTSGARRVPSVHRKRKKLEIILVHMDDKSHILHALNDDLDIRKIRESFHDDWSSLVRQWRASCKRMRITLLDPAKTCIDYIPPRIGILIDGEYLYAGRCSFNTSGHASGFNLKAGENEYFMYDRQRNRWGEERGSREIDEFEEYLKVYAGSKFFGINLTSDGKDWSDRLEASVAHSDVKEMTVISQTGRKFDDLISSALPLGFKIDMYVQDPKSGMPTDARTKVEALPRYIYDILCQHTKWPKKARVDIYYYRHCSTFRAALIGADAIGVQMYVHQPPVQGDLAAGEVRLVVGKDHWKYGDLKEELIDKFRRLAGVSRSPDVLVTAGGIRRR
jgi:hypothetical protein